MKVLLRLTGSIGGRYFDDLSQHELSDLAGMALWLEDDDGLLRRVVVREGELCDFYPTPSRPEGT